MKKILSSILVFTLIVLLCCSCNDAPAYGEPFDATITIDTTGHILHDIEIVVKDYGIITLTLDETLAPITVQNFLKLANEGFYDGLTFHRIMSGFMVQGGDPNGDGTGSSSEKIKGEFYANGVENDLLHKRGIISMARSGENPWYGITAEMANNSASCQFFIMHVDYPYLDGDYAAFGWVTSGMEFVDQICEDAKPTDNNGTIPKSEQPVIETIRVVTK